MKWPSILPPLAFFVSTFFSKFYVVLSYCEMFAWWFSSLFSHPMAHSVCLLLKAARLEAILLLFAWRPSHTSRLVLYYFYELFLNWKHLDPETANYSLSYTASSTIKAESACRFVVCCRVRFHSFRLFSKCLHLQMMKWRMALNEVTGSLHSCCFHLS